MRRTNPRRPSAKSELIVKKHEINRRFAAVFLLSSRWASKRRIAVAQEHYPARVHIRIGKSADFSALRPHGEDGGEHRNHLSAEHSRPSPPLVHLHDERHSDEPFHARLCACDSFSRFSHNTIISPRSEVIPASRPRAPRRADAGPPPQRELRGVCILPGDGA